MTRNVLSITGTRADYGLMQPVYQAIKEDNDLELDLIVTGMHLLPEFESTLSLIKEDAYGRLHFAGITMAEDSGFAMAQSFGLAVINFASIIVNTRPDLILLQGDRGEVLAGAIAAANMNIPLVHMSGGDYSGSIDDSIRNSISKFAHIHLTTCPESTMRLLGMGEELKRIFEVGEPGLDRIKLMKYIPPSVLAKELNLDLMQPVILATQHPVTTEKEYAVSQITETLEALKEIDIQTVFTYPNSDAGGREMAAALESYRGNRFIRIIPNLGSDKYLSLMKMASVVVGNSSSGILEAPSFKIPVVNIGTRQHNRKRANNVLDVGYNRDDIKAAIVYAINDESFKKKLEGCVNPYGDGNTAGKTVGILKNLRIIPELLTKWISSDKVFYELHGI